MHHTECVDIVIQFNKHIEWQFLISVDYYKLQVDEIMKRENNT